MFRVDGFAGRLESLCIYSLMQPPDFNAVQAAVAEAMTAERTLEGTGEGDGETTNQQKRGGAALDAAAKRDRITVAEPTPIGDANDVEPSAIMEEEDEEDHDGSSRRSGNAWPDDRDWSFQNDGSVDLESAILKEKIKRTVREMVHEFTDNSSAMVDEFRKLNQIKNEDVLDIGVKVDRFISATNDSVEELRDYHKAHDARLKKIEADITNLQHAKNTDAAASADVGGGTLQTQLDALKAEAKEINELAKAAHSKGHSAGSEPDAMQSQINTLKADLTKYNDDFPPLQAAKVGENEKRLQDLTSTHYEAQRGALLVVRAHFRIPPRCHFAQCATHHGAQ